MRVRFGAVGSGAQFAASWHCCCDRLSSWPLWALLAVQVVGLRAAACQTPAGVLSLGRAAAAAAQLPGQVVQACRMHDPVQKASILSEAVKQ
jgi:hypothetical protein